jgi:hypothetical protein
LEFKSKNNVVSTVIVIEHSIVTIVVCLAIAVIMRSISIKVGHSTVKRIVHSIVLVTVYIFEINSKLN